MPYFSRKSWKLKAEAYLRELIRDKPYADIINTDIMFIDNTRSGSRFWNPDDTVQKLLKVILGDAQRATAAKRVPLCWLPFTQGLRDQAAGEDCKPVLSLEEITQQASRLCGIPPEEVDAMLRFHHDLGLLLYYHRVPSLCQNVITKVQWLIKLTSALLHPLQTSDRQMEEQFRLLHDHGILLESLAIHIWSVHCPEEAASLSSPEQRAFLFCLYENFSMLYDVGKKMVPPGGGAASRAWLCPPLVHKLGEAVASLDVTRGTQHEANPTRATPEVKKSPPIYLGCGKGRQVQETQFWQLVVQCLSSQLRVDDTRMPSLFRRSARIPCDAVYPAHHLCISHFDRGLELVVLREEAAVEVCTAMGQDVPPLEDVCSNMLLLVEEKLEVLKGAGIAQPVWYRMGRCRCPLSSEPCKKHKRRECPSFGCLHFVDLSAKIPCCPLGERPAQTKVVTELYPLWIKVSKLVVMAKRGGLLFISCHYMQRMYNLHTEIPSTKLCTHDNNLEPGPSTCIN